MVKLNPVDVSKIVKCEHPDIKTEVYYLAKINNRWYAGTFGKQWYGWNFNAVYDAGFQLDYAGWQELYEVID